MRKLLQKAALVTIVATQIGPFAVNTTLLASEISSESDTIESTTYTETTSEASSEAMSEASSETVSEASSETVSEASSETVSEASSETMSEASSEATSEIVSEESSETDSEEVDDIVASVKIDNDGAISSKMKAARSASNADVELESDENLSTYVNEARVNAGSGESSITIEPTMRSSSTSSDLEDKEVYYVMNEDGDIESGSTKQPRSYEGNLLTVLNGQIVGADNAIVRTSGGYDYSFYIYGSIEDLESNTNGTPISGGGFDATYIETVEQDGKYYDHIQISGYDGYVSSENIQIVPEELIQARSYYTVEDGDWVYYSAIDPLTSTDYDVMVIDEAPAAAESGVKYYSSDDENYYTDPIITSSSDVKVAYSSYFMNLPFRSESNYTASDYKNYLKAKGKTSSEYYSETSAFTDAQKLESVNSLLLFSMANHESAYGLSSYAKACYNFFGRGAIDSDPDQACEYYSYPTAEDGILAQALFLENGYFDVTDWRYAGIHAGNKASGINAKYASDVDWGKKLSNHAYMIDQYLGGKEEGKYAIVQVSGFSAVYNNSGLTSKVKSSNDKGTTYSSYDLSQMSGTSNTINVVALDETSKSYKIYPPTGVKTSSSTECSYTSSMRGSYPNYNGRSNVSVSTNTANYSCDYGSFSNTDYWISTSGTKVISGSVDPGHWETTTTSSGTTKSFIQNGNVLQKKFYDKKGTLLQHNFYYTSGKLQQKNYYYANGNWKQKKYYNTNGVLTQSNYYSSNETITKKNYYKNDKVTQSITYYTNGKMKRNYFYNTNGSYKKIGYYNESGILTQWNFYYSNGNWQQKNYYYSNGKVKQKNYYDTNGNWNVKKYYNENGSLKSTVNN